MSALAEARAEHGAVCEQCGSALDGEQEWCLECGAARTLIHRPPDWRIAAAIVGTVVLLVLAGFAIALINLSGEANRAAATTAPATATATSASPPSTSATAIAGWPADLPGWTVVLFSSRSHPAALAKLQQSRAAGVRVGLLNTSEHPSTNMPPGHWVVFVGRYPTRSAAKARLAALRERGYRARARLVGLPGR